LKAAKSGKLDREKGKCGSDCGGYLKKGLRLAVSTRKESKELSNHEIIATIQNVCANECFLNAAGVACFHDGNLKMNH